ncbi:5'/3'-nucleotidase SurE [Sporomusa acidovorans]|uniref:5'-nucleotidase SurE n=1 Tax=Sporomusa acidovorans (strain ATCC 49682 / DSM 3132 / Mol) TaxID=1123286 RepID=A0ABZ3J2V8_SPOA4|nr:5'/3'-nucleotidase SurE [Sporomusa acidovorans]OZC20189.1 5'/3'-nucleotidase SurE [Sporomusa acidovorans DSM 3132]SDD42524.1 5'-nucleotidase /3'-nucleotidase /exopolyphosphatase [Sporomusa acidovorans]
MHILLTNDDGILAPGIKALWEELLPFAKITVVAPDSEKSASSQAITVHHPIWVDEHYINKDIRAWRVGGTPTDCVKVALESLLISDQPDIIVSGINQGSNLGTDVLYSGTVSAAIEGALHGLPAIAMSLDSWQEYDYKPAARLAKKIIETMINKSLPPNTLLNVNVPALPENQLKGIAITKLGVRNYENTFERRLDPRGRTYYWMSGHVSETENSPDSDIIALKDGKVSITPIHFDLTNYGIMNILETWGL